MKALIGVLICISIFSCQQEIPTDIRQTEIRPIPTLKDTLYLTTFYPDTVEVPAEITITGKGFDSIYSRNQVLLNNTTIKIISGNDSILKVQVTDSSITGNLTVIAKGKTAVSSKPIIIYKGDQWRQRTNFTGSFTTAVTGIAVNGKGYLYKDNDLWQFDPLTNQWVLKARRPSGPGGFYSFAFAIDDNIYFGANGKNTPDTVTLWQYNTTNDSWVRKNNLPVTPRLALFGFAINGVGYAGGGQVNNTGNIHTPDFWRYNQQNDTWTRVANFPGPWTIGLSSFVIGNNAYVYDAGMGFPQAPITENGSGRLWQYNPDNNTWVEKASCPGGSKAMSAVAFALKGKGYVGISKWSNVTTPKNDFWMYDPILDTWTKKADIGGGFRLFGSGFAINDKGYIGLGTGTTADNIKKDFWEYTPNLK